MTRVTMLTIALLAFALYSEASPTGLNNIPTADVVPKNILVLQSWINASQGTSPSYFIGAKYGLHRYVEIGADQLVGADDVGPTLLQAKIQVPMPQENPPVVPLLGIANVSDDSDEAGDADPYALLTADLGFARAHVGYSFQDDNDGVFAGIDKALSISDRDLVLRADIRQVDDGDEILSSAGFLHVLPWNLALESWVSFHSDASTPSSTTITPPRSNLTAPTSSPATRR